MWELDHKEGWALKNWCFWTVMLENILESPLDYRKIKPVNPEGNRGLMLKLKPQYYGLLMRRANSVENTLMLGKLKAGGEGDDRGRDGWMASLTRWTWAWASSGSWWRTGKPGVLQSMGLHRVGHDWVTEQQQSLKWKAGHLLACHRVWIWKWNHGLNYFPTSKTPLLLLQQSWRQAIRD